MPSIRPRRQSQGRHPNEDNGAQERHRDLAGLFGTAPAEQDLAGPPIAGPAARWLSAQSVIARPAIFSPFKVQLPSAFLTACVRIEAASEPAPDSVRQNAAINSPLASRGR